MKHLKKFALAALSATALLAFAAGTASATTLEVNGVTRNSAVTFTASAEGSLTYARTDGSLANTCTQSHFHGTTSTFTGPAVTGPLSTLSFTNCTRPVSVHKPGALEITHVPGTTNGTVFSENAEWTSGSPFGTINCKTGATTHLGTLTGVKSGSATLHINAVLNCGFLVPSSTWKGSYWITTPSGLGVSA